MDADIFTGGSGNLIRKFDGNGNEHNGNGNGNLLHGNGNENAFSQSQTLIYTAVCGIGNSEREPVCKCGHDQTTLAFAIRHCFDVFRAVYKCSESLTNSLSYLLTNVLIKAARR